MGVDVRKAIRRVESLQLERKKSCMEIDGAIQLKISDDEKVSRFVLYPLCKRFQEGIE